MNHSDHSGITAQRKAAIKRRQDAKALFSVGRPSDKGDKKAKHPHGRGAMYLAGYAIECKLKAIAMEVYRCFTLAKLAARLKVDEREIYTHGLESLAKHLPRLLTLLRAGPVWHDFASQVNRWRPSWRYDPLDCEIGEVTAFLASIDRVYAWLESNRC